MTEQKDTMTKVIEILVEYLKKATGDDASDVDKANIPKIAEMLLENVNFLL